MAKRNRILSDSEVRKIRKSPLTAYSLGLEMGINKNIIYSIREGVTYRDVPDEEDSAEGYTKRFMRGEFRRDV